MANLLLIRDLCEKNKIKIRELASRIGKDKIEEVTGVKIFHVD